MAGRAFLARVYAFRFLDGFVLIYPLYTVMFAARGLTPSQVAAVLMAWSVTGFVLQIPAGLLADRFSRRGLLCGAQALRAFGFGIWVLKPDFTGFLIGMVLWGVKSAFTNGVFEALVFDELHAKDEAALYPRVIGRAWGALSAAVLLTSLLTAVLVRFGYGAILQASFAMGLVAAASALRLPHAGQALKVAQPHYVGQLTRGVSAVARNPLVLGLIVFAALSQAFGGGMESLWQILGRDAGLSTTVLPLFGAAIGASQIVGSVVAHRMGGRGATVRFYALLGLAGLLLAVAAVVFKPWSALLVIAVAGVFKTIDVNFDARLHHAIPTESRATIASVKSFTGAMFMTAVLAAFGFVAQAQSYRVAFLAAGVILVAIGAAYLTAATRQAARRT